MAKSRFRKALPFILGGASFVLGLVADYYDDKNEEELIDERFEELYSQKQLQLEDKGGENTNEEE